LKRFVHIAYLIPSISRSLLKGVGRVLLSENTQPGIILFLVFLSFSLTGILSAQTEVEGDVYGIWDIEGSPYLVIDTLSNPEKSPFHIEPGVMSSRIRMTTGFFFIFIAPVETNARNCFRDLFPKMVTQAGSDEDGGVAKIIDK